MKLIRPLLLTAFSATAIPGVTHGAETVLTNCAQVTQYAAKSGATATFELTAAVSALESDDGTDIGPTVFDETGALAFEPTRNRFPVLQRGDVLRLRGELIRNEYSEPILNILGVSDIRHGPAVEPVEATAADLKSGRFDNRLVRMTGVVRNVFSDDIDPHFQFLILLSEGQSAYAVQRLNQSRLEATSGLLGATVSLTGICRRHRLGFNRKPHRHIERILSLVPDGIRIIDQHPTDFDSAPELSELRRHHPEDIPIDRRFRVSGRIIALWHGNEALLKQADGNYVRLNFAGQTPPHIGDSAEVVGFPESNLFMLGLTGALWRPTYPVTIPESSVTNLTVRRIMEDDLGRPKIDIRLFGQSVRIEGVVNGIRRDGRHRSLTLVSDGYFVPIEFNGDQDIFTDFPVGSRVAATGTCIMDIDSWRPSATFPRVHGFSVVLGGPADLVLLSLPPWWTPARLAVLLFSVLAILLASAVLNFVMKRIIERRTRQLEEEIGARVASESKVKERTRLAVELHDAISQTLTGVAFQLQTVRNCPEPLPSLARRHLDAAEHSLGSCRDELKNCLWDLRNNALECSDMNEAIRQTLSPHLGEARLAVRFEVARGRFTDNFTHALLHIIRELTVNAVRHGHASCVKVAGCIEDGRLVFSVTDDGCGFDPENCPGLEDGHFGLTGVRERMDGFGGELSVVSGACGTRITASMAMTDENDFKATT